MNELERLVRDTLVAHDKDAPDASRLLDDVRARVNSRRRNWTLVPLVTAALVVAVTAGIVAVATPDDELPPTGATRAPTSEPSVTGDETASPSPEPRPADTGPLASLTVHDGDAVTATGTVVQGLDGTTTLCVPAPMAAAAFGGGEPFSPTCSSLAVTLDVDEEWLPGWQASDGGGYAEGVTVDGVWRDGTLVVGSAEVREVTPGDELRDTWQVPCEAPADGWADDYGMPPDVDVVVAEAAIDTEVAAHPDVYHAYWGAYPDGDPRAPDAAKNEYGEPAHVVMVVSTVEEPTEVREHLATLYPGNLCVTQVDHSGAALNAVAARLSAFDESWVAHTNSLDGAVANRLPLEVPVLDEAAVTHIGDDAALLEVQPLVRPTS